MDADSITYPEALEVRSLDYARDLNAVVKLRNANYVRDESLKGVIRNVDFTESDESTLALKVEEL